MTNLTRKKKKDERKAKFVDNYKLSWGNVSATCDASGISRQTYYTWIKEDSDFAQLIHEIDERSLDMAETKLLGAVREGKTAELLFYLKTKGKRRGYVERTELTGAEGNELDVKITIVD